MSRRRTPLTARQRSPGDQLTFLAPSAATLVELVRRNLRLLAELRSTYAQKAGPRLLVDALGISPSQTDRYQRFLAFRAEQAVSDCLPGVP